MATSYPDRTNARGIWKLSDITRNIKTEGTFPGSTRILFGGGATPSVVNNIDLITVETTGDATDFGDLASLNYQGGGGNASSFSRGIFGIGKTPSGTDAIEYVQFSTTGNAADFGDKTNSVTGFAGASNKIRAVFVGGYSRTNVMDYITIATTGDAVDFGDLTVARGGTGAVSNGTRIFAGAGNNPSDNSVNVIDEHHIASTGDAVDFGDLVQATQNPYSGSNSTRAIFAGGLQQSGGSGPQLSSADIFEMGSKGNATDFGNLSAAMYSNYGSSSHIRAVAGGGSDPSNAINVIEYFTFASAGNAVDFGDLTAARQDTTPAGNGHGGLQTFDPRPPELYSPTGKVVPRGGGAGNIGVSMGRQDSSSNNTMGFIIISTTGNEVDFGDATVVGYAGAIGSKGGSTRGISSMSGSPGTEGELDYINYHTKGNASSFGNLSSNRSASSGCSNDTRQVMMGGNDTNVMDYITIATIGNASDFGDLTTNNNQGAGTSSTTRGLRAGGITPGDSDVIDYITIANTGNATDFGDLSQAKRQMGSANSTTRAVFAGGLSSPGASDLDEIEYVTISSTGNVTDFGNLLAAKERISNGHSNQTRGVFQGGHSNQNVMQYITIASTGNATDFGDLTSEASYVGSVCNGHGGLS
jgi:hypothetical protein